MSVAGDSSPVIAGSTQPKPSGAEGLVSLRDAAEELDVHYMTAYRYVRTGRMSASKLGGRWWIDKDDLVRALAGPSTSAVAPRPRAELIEPLAARLVQSDFAGSWQLIEGALASGATATSIHRELLGPAMTLIGQRWHDGELTIADEHRATSTVQRLLGRMSALFRPPGRRRGTVVLGAIAGDSHGLPSAMLADMLEAQHLGVIDLGANTPTASFAQVASEIDDLVGIGIVATAEIDIAVAVPAAAQLQRSFPDAVMVLGGAGVHAVDQAAFDLLDHPHCVVSRSSDEATQAFVVHQQVVRKQAKAGN